MLRVTPSDAIAVATPAVLASRSGRRPKRSERSVATSTKHNLTTPMASTASFEDMPAFRNTSGLYSTMASTLEAC
jgi:hypothetical protein